MPRDSPSDPGPLRQPGGRAPERPGHHRVAPGAWGLTWCLTGKPRTMMLDTRPGYGPGRPAVPRGACHLIPPATWRRPGGPAPCEGELNMTPAAGPRITGINHFSATVTDLEA